jgi:hypothetical protein
LAGVNGLALDAVKTYAAAPTVFEQHLAAHKAAQGQFFGQDGATGLCCGQQSIAPLADVMPGMEAISFKAGAWLA